MSTLVADQIVKTLEAAGVKRIYGIVGDSLNGITDALTRNCGIEWVHVRYEEVGAFAAGAEAHLTDELAVCAGSCGPGNLHLINGLFDCHRNRVPVLSIAALGRINAAKNYRNDGDSILRLFKDTVKGGDFRARAAAKAEVKGRIESLVAIKGRRRVCSSLPKEL